MKDSSSRMTYSEKKVAEYLRKMNIEWVYEQPVFVWDGDGRPRVWTPDFYLTQFGIYLEVCGSKEFSYEYRKRIFLENGYCVIFLHVFKGQYQWENHFKRFLYHFLLRRNEAFIDIFQRSRIYFSE
ncbi:MAG TPA: hypothetical protein DSN98_05175 [Thermoplasmata archaeon]|nr:MAG TPA: hypothetical protein DSN98_05175 [Thermoplasmata archaeon]